MIELVIAISGTNLIAILGAVIGFYGRLVKLETKIEHIESQISQNT